MVPISAAVLAELSDNEALSSDDADDEPYDIGAEADDDAALLAIVQSRGDRGVEGGAAATSDRNTSGCSENRSDRARRRAQREGRARESSAGEDMAEGLEGDSELQVCICGPCVWQGSCEQHDT